ncbi:MAG: hypothetical protein RIS47_1161 [Bacteroidota bacterium]|jgi:Fe-S cluster assembly protein SufD
MNGTLTKSDLLALAQSQTTLADAAQKQAALQYIETHELPGVKEEAWLKTNIRPLLQHAYVAAPALEITEAQCNTFRIKDLEANLLVFVNGHFAPNLSSIIDKGIKWLAIPAAVLDGAEMHKYPNTLDNVFTALNTAYAEEGYYVTVSNGIKPAHPLHVMHIATGQEAALVQARNLILLEDSAEVTVIESYHSLGDASFFYNVAARFELGAGAQLHYNLVQDQHTSSYLIHNLAVTQQTQSVFTAHVSTLGGALVRNNLSILQSAENIQTNLSGLYLLSGTQHTDNHILVHHAKPSCQSAQFYRGILDGNSSAVFTGKVLVDRGAAKTNASQSNKNILISDTAKASSKPQLEIYADDVACSHGSSTGKLDQEAQFYMVQRGLSSTQARTFLLQAFAADVLTRIDCLPLREHINERIHQVLQ